MSSIILTVGAIYVLEAVRKIPIQYAKKQTAQRLGSQATYLPFKSGLTNCYSCNLCNGVLLTA